MRDNLKRVNEQPDHLMDVFESENNDIGVVGTFKRWSSSAVECYVREAKCDGCYYQSFFSDKPYGCRMSLAVDQLLDTLGKPSKNLLEKYG